MPQQSNLPRKQQNPYVFKPKSYSRKAQVKERQPVQHFIPPTTKKFRTNNFESTKIHVENQLDQKYLLAQLGDVTSNFFAHPIRERQKVTQETIFSLPLSVGMEVKRKLNPQLSKTIDIVSTENEKICVPIHEGVLKANTNHSKNQNFDQIVNNYNKQLKKQFSEEIPFINDYKNGYTPIKLQNKSQKDEEREEKAPKQHFIKKKQSTLSLSRNCGVSYIKPSESNQKGPFDNLPPLIFQCSTSCNYTNELRQIYHEQVEKLIRLSEQRWLPAIMTNQENMRDLLLGRPHGKVIWVYGIQNIWPLLNEGIFLLVLFDKYLAVTEQQVWSQFNSSFFKFGILAKKSTSGRKLFMKSIQGDSIDKADTLSIQTFDNIDENTNRSLMASSQKKNEENELSKSQERQVEQKKMEEEPQEEKKQSKDLFEKMLDEIKNNRTVITMALKFQMYVHQNDWKNQTTEGKNILNAVIHSFEERLQKKSVQVIKNRFELLKRDERGTLIRKAFQNIRFGDNISMFQPAPQYFFEKEHLFSMETLRFLNSQLEKRIYQMQRPEIGVNEIFKDKDGRENVPLWEKALKTPIYYISTRDSFAFDLVEKITTFSREGRTFKKIEYSFYPDNMPDNFGEYKEMFPNFETGVVCYHDFFSEEEIQYFEDQTMKTQRSAFKSKFLQMTVQPTIIGTRIKRSKFFFGYRYMWTRCQLTESTSYVGAGVRKDVTEAPKWLKNVENPMVEHKILEPNFLNSYAINVYHDGSEGLAQHFDDAVRFRQPIYTLRLVSDGRLSFGSQFYGFCNGAFIIPLPRGCICVMNENSYAANGVKHCVRPVDMSGKSAAIIMRQMHTQVVSEAAKYDEMIDFPAWLSSISEDPKAITYAEQKRIESEKIIKEEDAKKREKALKLLGENA